MLRLMVGVLALALAAGSALPGIAQEEEKTPLAVWQKQVDLRLNILQSSFSDNWNGGGTGSVNWTGSKAYRFSGSSASSSRKVTPPPRF